MIDSGKSVDTEDRRHQMQSFGVVAAEKNLPHTPHQSKKRRQHTVLVTSDGKARPRKAQGISTMKYKSAIKPSSSAHEIKGVTLLSSAL